MFPCEAWPPGLAYYPGRLGAVFIPGDGSPPCSCPPLARQRPACWWHWRNRPGHEALAQARLVLIALHVAAVILSSRRNGQNLVAAGDVN